MPTQPGTPCKTGVRVTCSVAFVEVVGSHPRQHISNDAGVALFGFSHEPPFITAIEALQRIVKASMLVTGLGSISALDVAPDFNLANVECSAVVWKPQEVEDLRALGFGVIKQQTATSTGRQAAVAVESTTSKAIVERDRKMIKRGGRGGEKRARAG